MKRDLMRVLDPCESGRLHEGRTHQDQSSAMSRARPLVGLGLKSAHYEEVLRRPVQSHPVTLFEVHAENLMGDGGAPHACVEAVADRYALSVHGTGLSLGSAHGLDERHLRRFREVVARYAPLLVSEHLAWCRDETTCYNDLLPLPLNEETLAVVTDNLARAQDTLGRRLLVENPSSYLGFRNSSIEEPDFLLELVQRSDCRLLLDINNVFVSCSNLGTSAASWLARIPGWAVAEVHLAGHSVVPLGPSGDDSIRIDDHGSEVCDAVWTLYENWFRTQENVSELHTLVEWDTRVPSLDVLLAQATRVNDIIEAEEHVATGN